MAIAIASVPVLKGAASERFEQQMKESENKIIAISGETPEQMEELRINAIREIANQWESAGERHRC